MPPPIEMSNSAQHTDRGTFLVQSFLSSHMRSQYDGFAFHSLIEALKRVCGYTIHSSLNRIMRNVHVRTRWHLCIACDVHIILIDHKLAAKRRMICGLQPSGKRYASNANRIKRHLILLWLFSRQCTPFDNWFVFDILVPLCSGGMTSSFYFNKS